MARKDKGRFAHTKLSPSSSEVEVGRGSEDVSSSDEHELEEGVDNGGNKKDTILKVSLLTILWKVCYKSDRSVMPVCLRAPMSIFWARSEIFGSIF